MKLVQPDCTSKRAVPSRLEPGLWLIRSLPIRLLRCKSWTLKHRVTLEHLQRDCMDPNDNAVFPLPTFRSGKREDCKRTDCRHLCGKSAERSLKNISITMSLSKHGF